MAAPVDYRTFGLKLCEALHIPSYMVRSIEIKVEPDAMVRAVVERYLDAAEADSVIKLLNEDGPIDVVFVDRKPHK